jgi:hypothetical protein
MGSGPINGSNWTTPLYILKFYWDYYIIPILWSLGRASSDVIHDNSRLK